MTEETTRATPHTQAIQGEEEEGRQDSMLNMVSAEERESLKGELAKINEASSGDGQSPPRSIIPVWLICSKYCLLRFTSLLCLNARLYRC